MNLNCNADAKNMKTASITYDPFTFQEFYQFLENETVLKILLYLREKNPEVSIRDLAELTGKNEGELRAILNMLSCKQIIDETTLGNYNLNSRSRDMLDILLSK
jgi:DNA-binding transcriptional ArsR family regulator